MHWSNVTILLLYLLEASLTFGNVFQAADGADSRRRARGPSTLAPCPHSKCQCKPTKKGGLSATCDKITGSLPPFQNVNKTFELFSVAKRNITSLPASGFVRIRTRILDVGGNPLESGQVSTEAFVGLEAELQILWMSDCGLVEVPSESLAILTHLKVLHLEGNRFSHIPARFLAGNRHLKELFLFENGIESIDVDAFTDMTSLEQLKLGQNRIRTLNPRVFGSLVNLTSLDLSRNYLQAVTPGVLDGLKSLRWLQLDSNQIRSLERDSFRGVRNLRNMKIENNPMSSVEDSCFRSVPKLGYLSIDFSNVTALTSATFAGLSKLKTLSLGEIASQGNPLPPGLLASARNLKRVSLTDYQSEFGGLWKNMFSDKLPFKGLSVFLTPIRDCHCSLAWINELTSAGAYVHGYCKGGQPLSCTAKPVKKTGGKSANNDKRFKNGEVRNAKKPNHSGGSNRTEAPKTKKLSPQI